MAKYTVNFSCGHTETVQLYGTNENRHRRIEYLETRGICSECWKEQRKIDAEIKADKSGLLVQEISYRNYRKDYPNAKTVPGSYNGKSKTIKVYMPKENE